MYLLFLHLMKNKSDVLLGAAFDKANKKWLLKLYLILSPFVFLLKTLCLNRFMARSLHLALVKLCRNIMWYLKVYIYRLVQIIASKQADLTRICFFLFLFFMNPWSWQWNSTTPAQRCAIRLKLSWSCSTTSCSEAHHARHTRYESHTTVKMHKWLNGAINATEWSQQVSQSWKTWKYKGIFKLWNSWEWGGQERS